MSNNTSTRVTQYFNSKVLSAAFFKLWCSFKRKRFSDTPKSLYQGRDVELSHTNSSGGLVIFRKGIDELFKKKTHSFFIEFPNTDQVVISRRYIPLKGVCELQHWAFEENTFVITFIQLNKVQIDFILYYQRKNTCLCIHAQRKDKLSVHFESLDWKSAFYLQKSIWH